ncbi:hypothetical protein M422DRAFT_238253 [Sphaerobolus stellatus SS14]|nr:hypothetical protein M422DRAFT_238253 [Sphaerobolus stellatus SS14]
MSMPNDEQTSTQDSVSLFDNSLVSHILTPGSTLNPTFLLIVDCVLGLLLFILITLLFATKGNLHFLALSFITVGLWGSVKWVVYELQQSPPPENAGLGGNALDTTCVVEDKKEK